MQCDVNYFKNFVQNLCTSNKKLLGALQPVLCKNNLLKNIVHI